MALCKRFLALELRTSRFGFAVIEEPANLLDWGVRSFGEQRGKLRSTVSDRIATLLGFYRASVVVARTRDYSSAFRNRRFRAVLRAIKAETERNSGKFRVLTAHQVKNHFAAAGLNTKHEIATSLTRQFEELSWKLPERRKVYQSELRVMLVFDALANGVALLGRQRASERMQRP